jgi:hypothetical protein
MRTVIGDGVSTRKNDPTLLKTVARGYKWFNELGAGWCSHGRSRLERVPMNVRTASHPFGFSFHSDC